MLQNDSHLNCLCVPARLIEALTIYYYIISSTDDLWYHVCPDVRNTVVPFAITCKTITAFMLSLFQKGTS